MLKKTKPVYNSYLDLTDRVEVGSPYKILEDSLIKNQEYPQLNQKQTNKNQPQHLSALAADYNKRLEQIKKKYISPAKTSRQSISQRSNIDVSLPPRKSAIINQNIIQIRKEYTPIKTGRNILTENNISINSVTQNREPLQSINNIIQQKEKEKQSTPKFQYNKKYKDEERIHSIDRINERIRNALGNINPKQSQPIQQSNKNQKQILQEQKPIIQIPSNLNPSDIKKQKNYLLTNPNQESEPKIGRMNKSYIQPSSSKSQSKTLGMQFETRMNQIERRIKKSQQDRKKLMENSKPIKTQISQKLNSNKTSINSKNKQEEYTKPRQQIVLRERSTTGMYTYRYGDYNINKSKNLFDQLKSIAKTSQFNILHQISVNSTTTVNSIPTSNSQILPSPAAPKTQIKRLIKNIVQQIKLDEQFKNSKIWLESYKDVSKWAKLKQIISKKQNKHFTQSEIKAIFKCTQDDQNPFYSDDTHESIEGVVSKYYLAEQHWKSNILHKFNTKKLNQQCFKEDVLDLQMKGYLQIEDIVRYINIETGKFYRNRDLITLYKRITRTHRLVFEDLIKIIEKQ